MDTVLAVVSLTLSIMALGISLYTWRLNFMAELYDVADARLQEIHMIELQHPEFHNPEWCKKAITSDEAKIRDAYDVYASIVWNFMEALYDRYGTKVLAKSPYYSAMKDLAQRHSLWLYADENLSFYPANLISFLGLGSPPIEH